MGGHIMHAADCKNLSKSPVGDFRQPETNPFGLVFFSTGACTWAKILIRLQVWNLFAMGGQIMRAADCKNLSKSPVGDFRQPETNPFGLVFFVRFCNSRGMERAKPSYRSTVIMLYCFINRISSRLTFSFCSSSSSWFRRFLEKSILIATGIMGLLDRPVNRPHFTSVLV